MQRSHNLQACGVIGPHKVGVISPGGLLPHMPTCVYSNSSYFRPSSVFHLPKNKVAYLYRASKFFDETYTHAIQDLMKPVSKAKRTKGRRVGKQEEEEGDKKE